MPARKIKKLARNKNTKKSYNPHTPSKTDWMDGLNILPCGHLVLIYKKISNSASSCKYEASILFCFFSFFLN